MEEHMRKPLDLCENLVIAMMCYDLTATRLP